MEDAAVQGTVNHPFYIGSEKPVSGCEPLVPAAGLQRLKVVFNTLIVFLGSPSIKTPYCDSKRLSDAAMFNPSFLTQ
jgi:hypothetical protein